MIVCIKWNNNVGFGGAPLNFNGTEFNNTTVRASRCVNNNNNNNNDAVAVLSPAAVVVFAVAAGAAFRSCSQQRQGRRRRREEQGEIGEALVRRLIVVKLPLWPMKCIPVFILFFSSLGVFLGGGVSSKLGSFHQNSFFFLFVRTLYSCLFGFVFCSIHPLF